METIKIDSVGDFLAEQLHIPNWKTFLEKDELGFLKVFVRQHVSNIYFQNVSLSAMPSRRNPTEEEIISNGLSGNGGVCIHSNWFCKLVLDALGFKTIAIAGTWNTTPPSIPGTHCMVVVYITKDEMYLIDVGVPKPIWEPIPLHFLPYTRYTGGYGFEFRKSGGGVFQKFQLRGDPFRGDYEGFSEKLHLTFELKSQKFQEFNPAMKFVLTSPTAPNARQPSLFRHCKTLSGAGDPDHLDSITIWGKTVVECKSDSSEVTTYNDYDDMKDFMLKRFPKLNRDEVNMAFQHWKGQDAAAYRF